MSDSIIILEKTSINVLPDYILLIIVGFVVLLTLIPTLIVWIVLSKKKVNVFGWVIGTELIAGFTALILAVIFIFNYSKDFAIPSGKFRYEATVNKNNITVSEYEDFIEKYKPEIKDGIYYFETSDILEWDT